MQRFTISLDDQLAEQFDALIADNGYVNRSEAVRDLIRSRLNTTDATDGTTGPWCVANVSYVFNHHEQTVTARVLDMQHDHHDLVITSLHTHLDHDNCLETVVLRGPMAAVRECAAQLVALRGVRHGNVHVVPLEAVDTGHRHSHQKSTAHRHMKPKN